MDTAQEFKDSSDKHLKGIIQGLIFSGGSSFIAERGILMVEILSNRNLEDFSWLLGGCLFKRPHPATLVSLGLYSYTCAGVYGGGVGQHNCPVKLSTEWGRDIEEVP